jgi:hypothetical protein
VKIEMLKTRSKWPSGKGSGGMASFLEKAPMPTK